MKKVIYILFFLITTGGFSQNKNVTPNYSFFKLLVTNSKGEIVLVKWGNDWEIQGRKYQGNYGVKEFVKNMAKGIGVEVKNIRLRSLLTFHFKGYNIPTLMHYYEAEYVSGKLIVPPSCNDIAWVPFDKALKQIAYKDMISILKQIHGNNYVWGAAMEIVEKTINNPRKFSFKTKYYKLNE